MPDSLTDLVVARVGAAAGTTRRALLMAAALSQPTTELMEHPSARRWANSRASCPSTVGRIQFAHPSARVGGLRPSRRTRSADLCTAAWRSGVTEPEERARHAALGAIGTRRRHRRQARSRRRRWPSLVALQAQQLSCSIWLSG